MNTLGRHLVAELYGCDLAMLDDAAAVEDSLRAAALRVGATILAGAFHRFSPAGVSGTLLIAESHLSIHTWPVQRYVAADIFTCGGLDPRPGFELLAERFGAASTRIQEIVRGLPDDVGGERPLLPEDVVLVTAAPEVRRRAAAPQR